VPAPDSSASTETTAESPAAAGLDVAERIATRRSRAARVARGTVIDLSPLRHADFRRLWTGNSVAFVGFAVTAVAVPVQVFHITGSSFWVGLLGAVGFLPLVVFGLWGGAIADAADRRALLIGSSVVMWGCTLALLLQALAGLQDLALLLVLVAVQSGAFAVASSTRGAVVPRVLPASEVASANTLNFTASTIASAVGPLLAGAIVDRGWFAVAYGLDAALFTLALYAALRLPALPPLTEGEATAPRQVPGLRSVAEGLAFISKSPVLLLSFAVDIAAMVLAMPRALFPQAAAERFGGGVGWLFASIAIGSSLAGLSSGWIRRVRRQGVALVGAVLAWGVAVAASGIAPNLATAVALLAVAGAADLVSAVYRQTILQTYAPDELRGRLQGVFVVVVAGGPRLGDLRAGATAAAVGLTGSWTGGGIACVLVVLPALFVPALRHYTSRT
jgi:MFS family permease